MSEKVKTDNQIDMAIARNEQTSRRYIPPTEVGFVNLGDVLKDQRALKAIDETELFGRNIPFQNSGRVGVYASGNLKLLNRACVSVVGSRNATIGGLKTARELSELLCKNGFVVVSGLARGIDSEAHNAAIEIGGDTIAVIGTPLDVVYPPENLMLQEIIYKEHLLVSPFAFKSKIQNFFFPIRNRFMAALAHATVIVEASETSGTYHQAEECLRLKRKLYVNEKLYKNAKVRWLKQIDDDSRIKVFTTPKDVLKDLLHDQGSEPGFLS